MKLKQLIGAAVGAMLATAAFAGGGVNPAFIKWQKMKAAGLLPSQRQTAAEQTKTVEQAATPTPVRVRTAAAAPSGLRVTTAAALPKVTLAAAAEPVTSTGLMPDPVLYGWWCDVLTKRIPKPYGGYPRQFRLSDYDCVTSVKEQGVFQTCWAFASFGALESSILRQKPEGYTYTSSDIDFSEKHLVDNSGFDLGPNDMGNFRMALAYLLRWDGPVSESVSPYPAAGTTTWIKSDATAAARMHVQGARFVPLKSYNNPLNNDYIKNALMNYGAVYATYYADANNAYNSYNAENAAFYCPRSMSCNHAVLIVGWDDDFAASNFSVTPAGKGAYLVKNSWGTNWGDNGYFWVSYYDPNMGYDQLYTLDGCETKNNYQTIYQYDTLGYTGSHNGGSKKNGMPWMANMFTATTNDSIAAVGFYVLAPKTEYNIRIYTGCEAGKPSSGTLAYDTTDPMYFDTLVSDDAGFVTIPLTEAVEVEPGTRFSVCVQLQQTQYSLKPLAYEAPMVDSSTGISYSMKAAAALGQSYYAEKIVYNKKGVDTTRWTDLASKSGYANANFCVKAYGLGDGEGIDVRLVRLEVEGPASIAAGGTGTFSVTAVYSDGSRYPADEADDFACEVVGGQNAVDSSAIEGAGMVVTVSDGLSEDVEVGLRFAVTDACYNDESGEWDDVTVVLTNAFTAAKRVPDAVTDLAAAYADDEVVDTGVRLSWTAIPAAAGYTIYRADDADADSGKATFLASIDAFDHYTDTTAEPCKDYTYFIKAKNSAGSSGFSNGATGWRKLAAPADFVASDGTADSVQLSWTEVEGAHYYRVYRADEIDDDGNPVEPVIPVTDWENVTATNNVPPLKGHPYFYFVKAAYSFTGYRPSDYSVFDMGSRMAPVTVTSVQIEGPASVLSGSTNVFTLAASLSTGVRVAPATNATWVCSLNGEEVTGDELSVEAFVAGKRVATNTIFSITASWTHTDADGSSVAADTRYVTIVPVVPSAPFAPKLVEADAANGATFTWPVVDGASSYKLYRGTSLETAEVVNGAVFTIGEDDVTVADRTIVPGVDTYYWAAAVNAAGESAKSGASAVTRRAYRAPRNVTASNGGDTVKIVVTWSHVDAARYYRVFRAESKTGEKTAVSDWISSCRFEDAKVKSAAQFWYFVQAAADANGTDASEYSEGVPGYLDPAKTLSSLLLDGPSSIQYNSRGSYTCTAIYANGSQKSVQPSWSFKSADSRVTVSADGVVDVGLVEGEDLHLELEASYTDNGITVSESLPITIVAKKVEAAVVFVSNIVVSARWPWNGLVDIKYDLWSQPGTASAVVSVFGYDHDLNRTLEAKTLSGDGIDAPAAGGAPHAGCHVVWNLGADYTNFHASAFSVSLSAVPFAVAAPTEFRASDNTSTNGVELAWDEAFGAIRYEILRSTGNLVEDATLLATVTDATDYTDTSATAGETYYYWIRTVAGDYEKSTYAGPVTGKRALPPYQKESLNIHDGLLAYYPLDASRDDLSGSGLHLVFTDGDEPTDVAARSESAGTAFAFAGETALSARTNGQSVVSGTFTFAAWVKTTEKGTLRAEQTSGFNTGCSFLVHPFASASDATVTYGLSVNANGINVFERNKTYLPAVLKYPTDLGTGWHHVAVTVSDNGAPTLYVDGAYAKTGLKTNRTKTLCVGEAIGGGAYGHYVGAADDICYYDRALNADEISALCEAGSPLQEGKPISVKPTVSVVYDATGVATVSVSCVEIDSEHGQDVVPQPTVYYSIVRNDGGNTVENREYTGAFTVDGDATVIAWSVKEGYYNSPRETARIEAGWKIDVRKTLGDGNGKIAWSTDGDADWVFDPDNTSDEVSGSMKSGTIAENARSTMTARFAGGGYLAFDWKVSSEHGFDFLELVVDGETTHKISGEVDWTELVIAFPSDDVEHVVTWTYVKDGGTSRGSDCGWVDNVTWMDAGSYVMAPRIEATRIGEGLTNLVTIVCETAGAEIKYKLAENDAWLDYSAPFELVGDGTVYAYAKVAGLEDSLVVKSDLRRSWLIRMRQALVGDDVTKENVSLWPDYDSINEGAIPDENDTAYADQTCYWWDEDRTLTSDGGFSSAKSPKIEHQDFANMYASFAGAGTLFFDRRVDSEAGWDVLTYYGSEEVSHDKYGDLSFDLAYAEAISGQIGWERVRVIFATTGLHVIEWEYDKDDTGSAGLDAGWVDNLKWVPGVFAPSSHSEKTGYTFVGWSTNENGAAVYESGTMLDAEAGKPDFYEVWTANPYSVVYNATPDKGKSSRQSWVYDQEQTLYPSTDFSFKRGYAFAGWTTNANGTVDFADEAKVMNLATERGAVVTLDPVLSAISYNVSFWENGARVAGVSDIAATYDVDFTFPTPAERDGWRFDGWSSSPTGEVAHAAGAVARNLAATAGADVRFYANWTQLASPLVVAVDIEEFDFDTNTTWFVQTNVVHQGESALQSGKISGSQSSTLTAVYVATNKTRFTFWWKVSSEPTYDALKFTVNGKAVAAISGLDGDWQKYSTVLSTGENTLEWTYSKDSTGDRGSDCGWLDHLSLEFVKVISQDGDVFVAENGSDETGDGSEANPFRTIQMGVDCVDDGKTVHVKPGLYPSFASDNRSITIESTEGAANTIIDGALWQEAGVTNCCAALGDDPVTHGARSYYCNTKLIGFTLQHGSNGVCGGSVYNCIIQDCYSGDDGGGALGSTLYNCVLTRNYAADGAGAVAGGACRSCTLYNCTVYNNRARSNGGGIGYCVAYNCIIWHNYEDSGVESNVKSGLGWGSDLYNCITDKDPLFTDAANGDFTLQQNSPAIDAGNSSVVTYSTDLAGNGRIGGDAVDCGAYEFDPSTVVPVEEPVFKVIQYCINKQPYTVDDAVAATNTPSIWKHDPVTETYGQICFRDNAGSTRQNFQSSSVKWPATIQDGYKSDYFACQITGTVNVPEAGNWTFCVGSDDGYKMILTDEDGKTYQMQYYRDRSYANDIKTFNLTKAGKYKVYIIYFEYVETSILEVSCAKGSQWRFNSSKFKLLGTPESGITLTTK